jgi:cytochrome P450
MADAASPDLATGPSTTMEERLRDPYPTFAWYRENAPIWQGALADQSMIPPEFLPAEQWVAFRYEDVSRIFRDTKAFNSSGYGETIGLVFGPTILGMDGSTHRDHRNLVANAFKEKSLQRWEPEVIAPICQELVNDVAGLGHADLVESLTFEFPTRIVARLLGLPPDDLDTFRRLSIQLIGIQDDINTGLEASAELQVYFQQLIDDRRSAPADDMITDLVEAEIDGEKLTDELIVSFLRLLLPAGLETTFRSSGNLLYLLLTHPDQFEMVRKDRSLVGAAIEEALRLETPLTGTGRTAVNDVELHGQLIHQGASVTALTGSANRDPRRWQNPDVFDITREPIPHIAFAAGPHLCIGLHLARLETRVMLNVLMNTLPDLTFDPGDSDPHIHGMVFRSPDRLPVTFTPR